MKPFTTLAAIVLLVVAGVHAYRLYSGAIAISVAGHVVPVWASWPGAIIAGLMGIMLFVEARR
jgi:lipopolysaccharide export LptBFGC system permease protein LptF